MLKSLLPVLFLAVAAPAVGQDLEEWRFGGDAYSAGQTVTITDESVNDAFAAGYHVTLESNIDGSAHMAGRYINLEGRVGGNFYGAGATVDLDAPVSGNVTAMGESVAVNEPVSGNLRAIGQRVEINAPVAGSAVLAGQRVVLDQAISGDVALAAERVDWGSDASVAGTLHIYHDDPEALDVPESVAPASRIEFHATDSFNEFSDHPGDVREERSPLAQFRGWLGGILVVGLLGTLLAAVAPDYVASLRERALDGPGRAGWTGFVSISALVGSVLLLAMTGIGLILVPVVLVVAVLLGLAGYVVGTYVLGVWATGVAGRPLPATTGERAIAAFAGALLASVICLVPWVGWLADMAIFLVGAGALSMRIMGRLMPGEMG